MKIKITHYMAAHAGEKIPFCFETENAFEAYEAVKALIIKEAIMFPDRQEAFNHYLSIVSDIASGKRLSHEMHLFKIERMVEE